MFFPLSCGARPTRPGLDETIGAERRAKTCGSELQRRRHLSQVISDQPSIVSQRRAQECNFALPQHHNLKYSFEIEPKLPDEADLTQTSNNNLPNKKHLRRLASLPLWVVSATEAAGSHGERIAAQPLPSSGREIGPPPKHTSATHARGGGADDG
jgi:hypothetical protein